MEQHLADKGNGEEQTETKVGGVYLADKEQQPFQLFLYCVILALAR